MKKYPRFLAVILIVLFIGSLILTSFGIHTRYGDVNTSVFLSSDETNTGVGLSSEIMMTYYCPENTELTDELCNEICGILEKRLQSYGIYDAVVACDRSKAVFSVKLSYNSRTTYDPNIVYGYLGNVGTIEIRAGNEKDENGLPSGKTAETVIVDNTDLRSVSYSEEGSGSSIKYTCDLKYKGNSKKLIQEYTELIADADASDRVYSIWLDNSMITSRTFSSVIKNGVIPAGTSIYSSSSLSTEYTALVMLASSDKLPFALTSSGVFNLSDPDNHSVFSSTLVITLVSIAVIGLLLTLKYKLAGFAVLLGLTGFLGASGIVTSGGFDPNLGIYVSRNVLVSFITAALLITVLCVVILERIRTGVKEVSSYKAVTEAFKKTEKKGAVALCILVVLTVLVYLFTLLLPTLHDLQEVMFALTMYMIIGYITVILGGACISKSLASTKPFNSERLYGG